MEVSESWKTNNNGVATKRKRDHGQNDADGDDGVAVVDLSLLEALEKSQASQPAIDVLDLRAVKKLALSFERLLKDHIVARLKHPNNPDRFADSELELHDDLQKLRVLAGAPNLSNSN